MNKDIQDPLNSNTRSTSNRGSKVKLLFAFAAGAVVSFVALSYNKAPAALSTQPTSFANAAEKVGNLKGDQTNHKQVGIDYWSTYTNDTRMTYNIGQQDYYTYPVGFPSSNIRYCHASDDYDTNVVLAWQELERSTCIKGQFVGLEDDCQLVYDHIENEFIPADAITRSRTYYGNGDIFENDKIYIYYNELIVDQILVQKAILRETLRALGLESENKRKDQGLKLYPAEAGSGISFGPYDPSSIMHDDIWEMTQSGLNYEDYQLMGAATQMSTWDIYMVNVLYCPHLAMPQAMPLFEATHIHAFETNRIFYFSASKIGVRYVNGVNDFGYLWFYAPWNEAIVNVFPSQSDSSNVIVHTLTKVYSVNKYNIDPQLKWFNLPVDTQNSVVETSYGNLYLIYKDVLGYVYIMSKSGEYLDYAYANTVTQLYDNYDFTPIVAAAAGQTIYFKHRYEIYSYDTLAYSTNLFAQDGWTLAEQMTQNNDGTDGYLLIRDNNLWKLQVFYQRFAEQVIATFLNPECAVVDWSVDVLHSSRVYNYFYYLTNSGVICELNLDSSYASIKLLY